MTKEFEINDILNAVNSISKIEKREGNVVQPKKNRNNKVDILTLNKQVKPDKFDILVLDQMIE